MIDLYYWTTPNGHKVSIFLEEAGLPYKIVPVNIGQGEQFTPEFLKISPNNRIPAIVDNEPGEGRAPVALFESGAILVYLADKTAQFLPKSGAARYDVLQWLMWQMGGFGPMLGQNHHFRAYAPEPIPYAIERYTKEAQRLYSVLNQQLEGKEFICGDYTIADMACYPWAVPNERQGVDLAAYPHVARWRQAMMERPAVIRAYEKAAAINTLPTISDDKARAILFNQTSNQAPSKE